jgi:hypothetical protein
METKLMIFLAFASVTVVTNTLLIWFAYKAFAGFTSKVTETVTEFERSKITQGWIRAMQAAAERAVIVTEFAKERMASLDSTLECAQGRYRSALASADSSLERAGDGISNDARRIRDIVAWPAFWLTSFMAGVRRAMPGGGDD